jgi:hypothetical protein
MSVGDSPSFVFPNLIEIAQTFLGLNPVDPAAQPPIGSPFFASVIAKS